MKLQNIQNQTINKCTNESEISVIYAIKEKTEKENIDNISRTKAYERFYVKHKEIQWAFLASMVSRNAGWNMTDLEGNYFPLVLEKKVRDELFITYERANWLIFQDAYPQLLLYEWSKKKNKSYFSYLRFFNVSSFMEKEWEYFWKTNDVKRLMHSLIINEQNVIQKPVIEHPLYKKKVFKSFAFKLEETFHFCSVLFPTIDGELYGFSVKDFRKLDARISLGKRLASLLFHHSLHEKFLQFSSRQEHTGSRIDYERYISLGNKKDTPFLRLTYDIIPHHRHECKDWYSKKAPIEKWMKKEPNQRPREITTWFLNKRKELYAGILIESIFKE